MFGIGSTELLVILVVALLVLGPKNLPKIAQTLGRAMGEFRKVSTEFQRTLNTEIAFEEEAEKHAKAKKEQEAVQARENKPVKAETSAAPEAASAPTQTAEAPSSATPAGTAPSATETGNAKPEEKAGAPSARLSIRKNSNCRFCPPPPVRRSGRTTEKPIHPSPGNTIRRFRAPKPPKRTRRAPLRPIPTRRTR